MVVTTDRLLQGVKRRAIIATNTTRLDDDDLIALINDVIKTHVVPFVDSCNGNFFVVNTTTPIVAGQNDYDIPYRAIGRVLRDLKIVSSDGKWRRNCPEIRMEDAYLDDFTGSRWGYYFEGDRIVLTPEVDANYSQGESLEISYKIMPNDLVKLSAAAKVTSVSDPNVVVESVGDITTGSTVDFIAGKSGNSIYDFDATVTNVSGTTITFGSDVIPSRLVIGDYISLAQTSPVVNMIPDNCSPWIEILAVRKALQAIGDTEGANDVLLDIEQEQRNLNKVLEPRNEGEPKVIINRRGLVRGRLSNNRNWYVGSV